MSRIGIIGSSFSTGGDNYLDDNGQKTGQQTRLMLDNFTLYDKDNEYFSCGMPGYGSELYLSNITYLKQEYDINKILIEVFVDESLRHIPIDYFYILKYLTYDDISTIEKLYIHRVRHEVLVNSASDAKIRNHLFRYATTATQENNYLKVFERIHKDLITKMLKTLINMYQSLQLCKMLNIDVYLWKASCMTLQQSDINLDEYFRNQTKSSYVGCFPEQPVDLDEINDHVFKFNFHNSNNTFQDKITSYEEFVEHVRKLWNKNIYNFENVKYLNGKNFFNTKKISSGVEDERMGLITALRQKFERPDFKVLCDRTHLTDKLQLLLVRKILVPFLNNKKIEYVL